MLTGIRLYAALGVGVAFLLLAAWGYRVDDLRAGHLADKIEVTAQIANAVGNPKLKFKDIGEQVRLTVKSRDEWKGVAGEQTAQIDAMGQEEKRLKALNAELREKAKAEIAKRNRLIDRLENAALTPGDRNDCQAQIAAAEAALDAIYEEGL